MTLDILSPLAGWQETKLPFAHLVQSFVSGDGNEDRIHIRYFKTEKPYLLFGKVIFGSGAEGPPRHAHGGAQAAALDEVCGGALWVWGLQVVAAKLETEFLQMVPLNRELIMEGRLVERVGRKLKTEGKITTLEGEVLAKSSVLFVEMTLDTLLKLDNNSTSQ